MNYLAFYKLSSMGALFGKGIKFVQCAGVDRRKAAATGSAKLFCDLNWVGASKNVINPYLFAE
jgi:hypothetical protein